MGKKVFVDVGSGKGIAPTETRHNLKSLLSFALPTLAFLTLITLSLYIIFRGLAFFNPGYNWLDRAFAIILISAEGFLFVHTIGYLMSITKSAISYRTIDEHFFVSATHPATAVVVAAYNEDPGILEETLASMSNLDYLTKRLYLLDDSTNQDIRSRTQELGKKYGFTYLHRKDRRGYKAGALNDLIKGLNDEYIAVFDADQKPVANFLSQTVSLLEDNSKLAFVQTPQFYQNAEENMIAFGAAYQQVVFYEYICEGKSVSNAMFSCGSNVVYRVEALRRVGGFEEKSVTEDFATGMKLHLAGWQSMYYNYVYVYGLGPESLSSYFTQQRRWAMGTLGLSRTMLWHVLRNPRSLRSLKIAQWGEYFLSGSYYWVGWANFMLMLCPIAFLVFGIRPMIAQPLQYVAAFLPYYIFGMSTFYFSMGRRGYSGRYLLLGQSLSFNSFWVLMNAAIMALFNIKRPFGVTPKGVSNSLELKYLLPQILLIAFSIVAIVFGVYKVLNGSGIATLINVLWAANHIVMLSMIFYFNKPFKAYEPRPVYVQSPTVQN